MVASTVISNKPKVFSLEDYLLNPPDRMEWVDGELVEKKGMTARHGRTQSRLDYYWRNYMISSNQGGEVYTETSCRTVERARCPDVSYPHSALQAVV
ncbi:MAG: Uma2 family endonuclease [Xenococcaceae cyanobacterium]